MPHARTAALILLLVCAPACGPAAAKQAADAHAWKTYTNVRYQYAICYPADLLKAQGELDAHDGQTFKAADGGELTVFGANNVLDKSLAQAAHEYVQNLGGDGARVTYSAIRPDWAVLSGAGARGVFYAKTFKRRDQLLTFTLTYPVAAAARYDAITAKLSRCFKD